MKSVALLSLILSLSVACSSTSETNPDNQKPEVDASLAPSGDTKAGAENAIGEEANVEATKAEENLASAEATAGASPAEAAAPAPETAAPAPDASAPEQAAPKAEASVEKIVYPTASMVNLRQGPGKSEAVARVAKFGDSISLTGEKKNTWLKTTDGLWISSLFVSDSKPSQANDPVVEASAPANTEQAPEQSPAEQKPDSAPAQ